MPFAKCPTCDVEMYSAAAHVVGDRCPTCRSMLVPAPERGLRASGERVASRPKFPHGNRGDALIPLRGNPEPE